MSALDPIRVETGPGQTTVGNYDLARAIEALYRDEIPSGGVAERLESALTAPPSDDVIEVSNSEGDGFWCAPPSDEGEPADCENCDCCTLIHEAEAGVKIVQREDSTDYELVMPSGNRNIWFSDKEQAIYCAQVVGSCWLEAEAVGAVEERQNADFATSNPLEKLRHFMHSIGTTVTDGKDPDGTDFDVVDLAVLTIQGEIDRNPFDHPDVKRLVDAAREAARTGENLARALTKIELEKISGFTLDHLRLHGQKMTDLAAALPNQSTSAQKGTPNE